jgi:hypothetical protein
MCHFFNEKNVKKCHKKTISVTHFPFMINFVKTDMDKKIESEENS